MLSAFLLSLREGLEAALILGILLGAVKKMNRLHLKPAIWAGTLAAILLSLLTGGLLTTVGISPAGKAEQIFEGFTMLFAAGLLTWMIFWMNRQGRHLRAELENNTRRAALKSGRRALFGLAFLAVVREGVELALFGYNGNPSLTEALAYLAYFGLLLGGLRQQGKPAAPAPV